MGDMRIRVGITKIASRAVLLMALGVLPLSAQDRPRVGIGFGGGAVLGAELIEHGFQAELDSATVALIQEVNLIDVVVADAHAEWYLSDHVAFRAHASWGRGRLSAQTRLSEQEGEVAAPRLSTGFGDVGIMALDAGMSLWPWTPRTVGFAPFITVGYGLFSYEFGDASGRQDAFFRAGGSRTGSAIVVGAGADLRVWDPVVLRIEAVNHMVESPLRASDFEVMGTRRGSAGAGDDRVSNVRLVLAAHVYFPFDGGP